MNIVRTIIERDRAQRRLGNEDRRVGFVVRLHRDERGSISIISVFAALMLTILLGMVMNVGRQVDGKIRLQNAADAAAHSGGLVLTRGMNTLAFTNHMLCEIIAMDAILREASDPTMFPQFNGQLAARYVPPILTAWDRAADFLSGSSFQKFRQLGADLKKHLPQEMQLVMVFSQWAGQFSADLLPVFEVILQEELIPKYQRAVVSVYPEIAQAAVQEVARINGTPDYGRGTMTAILWRAGGVPVGGATEMVDPTLPVVDPMAVPIDSGHDYFSLAKAQRLRLAKRYLNQWNSRLFQGFNYLAPFSKFQELWFKVTCGRLEEVLTENAARNYPMQIRPLDPPFDPNQLIVPGVYNSQLEGNYIFTCVVFWKKVPELMSRIFRTPTESDSLAFAEIHLFQPKRRLVWRYSASGGLSGQGTFFGTLDDDLGGDTPVPSIPFWHVVRQESSLFSTEWNLLDQNWACQLAPATQNSLPAVLQTVPNGVEFNGFHAPNLGDLNSHDIQRISPH